MIDFNSDGRDDIVAGDGGKRKISTADMNGDGCTAIALIDCATANIKQYDNLGPNRDSTSQH